MLGCLEEVEENVNRRQFPWSPWLKVPQTGSTRTLTWIARIHSHTLDQHSYNHMVRSANSAIILLMYY